MSTIAVYSPNDDLKRAWLRGYLENWKFKACPLEPETPREKYSLADLGIELHMHLSTVRCLLDLTARLGLTEENNQLREGLRRACPMKRALEEFTKGQL